MILTRTTLEFTLFGFDSSCSGSATRLNFHGGKDSSVFKKKTAGSSETLLSTPNAVIHTMFYRKGVLVSNHNTTVRHNTSSTNSQGPNKQAKAGGRLLLGSARFDSRRGNPTNLIKIFRCFPEIRR